MGLLTVINDEGHFQAEMASAGVKLVVVDFTASWLEFVFIIIINKNGKYKLWLL